MKVLKNENLAKYTTFKMGGIVEKLYFPENIEELFKISIDKPNTLNYLIGGGSNLIINDSKTFKEAICLRDFNNEIKKIDENKFYIGASVRLQQAIKEINKHNCGGIEYLFSVPGLIGGAIYMNAGRGKKHNKVISDYIIKVDYIENGEIHSLKKEECQFSYRNSIFQNKKCIIIGALFEFDKMSNYESKEKIKERIELCKKVQDMSAPNFGTVFCESNKYIMEFARRFGFGKSNGVHFSKKTKNWMLNEKKGSYKQTINLINKIKKIHKLFRKKCRLEPKIWE
ncbi:MAG: FAD-binding protein [Bacilli bacterium]|nr:FAD-binding protein [Bacilli bacterium]